MDRETIESGRPNYVEFRVENIIEYVDGVYAIICRNGSASLQFMIKDEKNIPKIGSLFSITFNWEG